MMRFLKGMFIIAILANDASVAWGDELLFGYGLSKHVEDFSGFKKFSTKSNEDSLLCYAQRMLEDQVLYVCDSMPPYKIAEGVINWNEQNVASPSTFQLFLHGLTPVQVLSYAYCCTQNERYLMFAWDVVQKWMAFNDNATVAKANKRCWMDHTVALRAESLLYFTQVALRTRLDSPAFRRRMNDLLKVHCTHLADDSHYTINHNHGIIQDLALLHVAYFVCDDSAQSWIKHAKIRLDSQRAYAFNQELVHVENSPGYNIAIVKMFREVSDFLESMGDDSARSFCSDVNKMAEFLAWAHEPNGLIASIGDTFGSFKLSRKNRDFVDWGNDRLAFATTLGDESLSEDDQTITSKYYPDAGYYFYRSNWDTNGTMNATWKMFKSGYSSRTHKHADDLSFMIYGKGYEIFTDPGMYNYMYGDKFREYFTSSSAHNTITVDERSYSVTEENRKKTGMLSCETNGIFEIVTAFNDMYPGVSIDRHFISSGDLTVLYDDIVSDGELHRYRQLFHLSERMKIIESTADMVLLSITNSGYRVRIKQMTPTVMSIHHGDGDYPLYGHISRTMNVVKDSDTLVFERNGVSLSFVTVITIEDGAGNVVLQDGHCVKYNEIKFNCVYPTISCSGQDLALRQRRRIEVNLKNVQISMSDHLSMECKAVEGGLVRFEVVDQKCGKSVAKSDWANRFAFDMDLSGFPEDLTVAAEIKRGGQCKKEWLCFLKYRETLKRHQVATCMEYPYLNLKFYQCKMTRTSSKSCRVELNYDYSLATREKWYVYRNGSGWVSANTKNQRAFEFECLEPGRYAVLCFLDTIHGDSEFYITPEVLVSENDTTANENRKSEEDFSRCVAGMAVTKENTLEISMQNYSYAVYLVDAKTAKAVYRGSWQKDKTIKCPLGGYKKDMIVRLYIRSSITNERRSIDIGRLVWNDSRQLYVLSKNKSHALIK